MKKLLKVVSCYSMLVFCFNVCIAQDTKPIVADTWCLGQGGTTYGWTSNFTFVQKLKATADGSLSLLWVHMGNNQHPYSARVVIKINDVKVFDKDFSDLKQNYYRLWRCGDVSAPTEFSLEGISQKVKIGDNIELQITPSEFIGMNPVLDENENWTMGQLPGYRKVALRFRLR